MHNYIDKVKLTCMHEDSSILRICFRTDVSLGKDDHGFTSWKSVVDEGRLRDMVYRFSVVSEKAEGNYSAYSPDLPGCIAVGDTLEEVQKNMEKAVCIHIEGMIEDNEPLFSEQTSALLRKLFHAILHKYVKHI